MKVALKKILPSLATTTLLSLTSVLIVSLPTLAIAIPGRVTNGLYRSSSEEFFQQGRRQLDREIKIILERRLTEPENLLEISDELLQQQERSPLENYNISPNEVDKIRTNKPRRFRGD